MHELVEPYTHSSCFRDRAGVYSKLMQESYLSLYKPLEEIKAVTIAL